MGCRSPATLVLLLQNFAFAKNIFAFANFKYAFAKINFEKAKKLNVKAKCSVQIVSGRKS
jgi:hypothetical protein